ncbi:hypothetical protein A2773_04920 [Candidatus Gottesmanbacteria bacterium RIFCSPHIGHO2_01_FULL_39_10]|uniref:Uncharacterized protein n=1 Tax=Candidatus Gottesmanbacteria bacterium RIFCSPHIGHO2_01_FULL_39_10 TaxID=1798375 RepID=A0A1F5ZRX2_9BACT|nr:MAG: hypothetical protein A2773_04920 [Candidatus Gottesmanbacteria bacterium RIFCSPHIGHO2_01_FULL_39_10]
MHLWRDENGYSAFAEYYPLEQNWSGYEIDDTEYNVVFISTRKSIYKKMLQLVDNGKWKLRYRDDDAAIFERI